jgi:DNA topoisomerase-1
MDKAGGKTAGAPAGISIRNGPVLDEKMDVDMPSTNGNSKRKARTSTSKAVNYTDDVESDSSDAPLVCTISPFLKSTRVLTAGCVHENNYADEVLRPSVSEHRKNLQNLVLMTSHLQRGYPPKLLLHKSERTHRMRSL